MRQSDNGGGRKGVSMKGIGIDHNQDSGQYRSFYLMSNS